MVNENKKNTKTISLIGNSFDKGAGQGIDKCCGYLSSGLSNTNWKVDKTKLINSKNPFHTVFTSTVGVFFKLLHKKSSLYHFTIPTMAIPCVIKRPSVVTIYDLIPFILKNERKKSYNLYFRFMFNFIKKADHIIAISDSTKNDAIKYLGIPKEKITRIYPGVDHGIFYPAKKINKGHTFNVGFLGGLVKRKNAKILIEVAKKIKDKDIIFKIGGKGAGFEELKELKRINKLKNVEFLGFVPDDKLNEFYNSLDVFIAPTTYDGFCMPGMEAMASGCPVILSNTGAHPEVAGNAGIKINPTSVSDIINAIMRIKNNNKLKIKMGIDGLKHSNNFSWEKNTKETLKVYEKIRKDYEKNKIN